MRVAGFGALWLCDAVPLSLDKWLLFFLDLKTLDGDGHCHGHGHGRGHGYGYGHGYGHGHMVVTAMVTAMVAAMVALSGLLGRVILPHRRKICSYFEAECILKRIPLMRT